MLFREKIWVNIYQMQKLDELIHNKNESIIEIDVEDFSNREKELEKIKNEIIEEFLKLNFDKISSVEIDKQTTIIEESESTKKMLEHSKTSLLKHIQDVLNFVEINKDKFNENEYEYLFLFALFHDAGKSKKLRAKYNINSDNHEQASGVYAKLKLKDTTFSYVGEAIYSYSNEKKDDYILKNIYKKFHEIDKQVRINELGKNNDI